MTAHSPILMLVTDPIVPDLDARVDAAIQGGVTWVQYRDRNASSMDRVMWISRFRERHPHVPLLVNGDIEAAAVSGAFGIHLHEDGMPAVEAGRRLGPDRAIGRSLHWGGFEVGVWREKGLGYVVFGTVFQSATHPDGTAAGVGRLRKVCTTIRDERPWLPVLAIGGIHARNARRCRTAGAAGVAVIRSVLLAPDPAQAAADIVLAMKG